MSTRHSALPPHPHTFSLILLTCLAIIFSSQWSASGAAHDNKVKEKLYLSLLSRKNVTLKERRVICDSLMVLQPNNIIYMLRYADAAMHLGEFDRADSVLTKAERMEKAKASPESLSLIKLHKVRLNRMQGKIVNAVIDATDLLNIKKPDSLKYMDVEINLFLADGYLNLGSVNLSNIYLKEANRLIASKSSLSEAQISDFRNNALAGEAQIALYSGEKEKALSLVLEALKYDATPEHTVFLKLLMGAIYEELGEYDLSLNIYKEILDSGDESWWTAMALPRYGNMLMVHNRGEELDSVITHYANFANMIHKTHRGISMDYLRALNMRQTNPEEAWNTLLNAYARLDEFAFYHAHGSRQADVIYDIMEVKHSESQKQLKRARILIWIGIGMLIATFINFLFMLRKIKQKKKENRHLNSTLEKKEAELNRKEAEFHKRLQARSHEMTAVTMILGRLNELMDAIKSETSSKLPPAEKIRNIESLLSKSEITDSSDRMLKVQFSQTHGDLLDRLCEKHPNITNGEQKMAIYILLGYSTREIAELTFRSPRSVETMKYRMAKKILTDTSLSLEDYLKSFMVTSS